MKRFRFSTSLRLTVPLILLGFAATLSTVNLMYHVPQAERGAEEDNRKRLGQEMSRLQSTLEYLLLKGDTAAAQHEIAVLAHNHDVILAAMTDERQVVIAATRRAWLGQQIDDVLPQFDLEQASGAIRERRAGMATDSNGDALLGHAGILLGGERDELRPSRTGSLFLAYDLKRYKAEARAQVVQQSLYWAGWVTALALAMWLAFHFLLTRRTARLVRAAEAARRRQPVRAQPLARHRRAWPAEPRVRRDGAEGRRHAHATAAGHRGSQTFGRSAARIRGKLPRDLRRRRGRDFPARRIGRHRRRQSQGVLRRSATRARNSAHSRSARSAPARRRSTTKTAMGLIARAFGGERLRVEWHGKSKDGTLRWHEVFVKRVTIGGHDRMLALARDITGRKAAEAALRASEEQYHSMFNASIDGLALWTAAGRDRRHQSCAVAHVWLWRRRVFRRCRPAHGRDRRISRRSSARSRRENRCTRKCRRSGARTARRSSSKCTASRCSTRASPTC